MIKEMKSEYLVDLYTKLESLGIKIWIDGGWAVDALLEKITRTHSDLDLAIEHKNVQKFREFSKSIGYKELKRDENKKWDFVLTDNEGHELDVHSFSFDENGEVIEEDDWDGLKKGSLSGVGVINGAAVRCVSVEHLLGSHDETRRALEDKDNKDVKALKEKFNC